MSEPVINHDETYELSAHAYIRARSYTALLAENAALKDALTEMMEYAGLIEERCDDVATGKARAALGWPE